MSTNDYILRSDAKEYAHHAYVKGLNLMEYINEIPAADVGQKQKWVPVRDILPRAGREYWTLRYFERLPIIQPLKYGVPDGFDNEYFYAHDDEWGEDTVYGGITHWLPLFALPELPGKE